MLERPGGLSDLIERLTQHAPADATEATHRRRMLELAQADGDCLSRAWLPPHGPGHFTASAFVLSPDERDVLLILHSKFNIWLQPGGHVDPEDHDITAAALREVAEETGKSDVDVIGEGLFDLDIHDIPASSRKGEAAHEHFDVRVLLKARSRDFQAGSDANAAKWVALADVADAGTDDSVLRAIRKLVARNNDGDVS